jgi:hypothetical protein
MIRPAEEKDIPIILKLLSEIPNPPYQEDVASLLASPNNFIWINDRRNEICRIALDRKRELATLVWLLPLESRRFRQLRELARTVESTIVTNEPKTASWHYRAEFQHRTKDGTVVLEDKGLALCEHFRDNYYSGATVTSPTSIKAAEIFWTLGEAVNG